jgi:hypothetical protein
MEESVLKQKVYTTSQRIFISRSNDIDCSLGKTHLTEARSICPLAFGALGSHKGYPL